MSEEVIHYGLDGVVVDTTNISKVMPEINSLVYRGYPVQELAEHCSFEEVAWLIWHGELPTAKQLTAFMDLGRHQRGISNDLLSVIQKSPRTAHPMDVLRTAVSFLGMEDSEMNRTDAATNLQRSVRLMAKIPTMLAAFYRLRKGQESIPPRNDLGFVENFFHMVFGKVPAPEVAKAFEVSMVLYAEHGFNASTFTARTVVSSLSDIYSGVVGGIASLKGALHGGANEAVMHMLLEIGEPTRAKEWMLRGAARASRGDGLRPSRLQKRRFARADDEKIRAHNGRVHRANKVARYGGHSRSGHARAEENSPEPRFSVGPGLLHDVVSTSTCSRRFL